MHVPLNPQPLSGTDRMHTHRVGMSRLGLKPWKRWFVSNLSIASPSPHTLHASVHSGALHRSSFLRVVFTRWRATESSPRTPFPRTRKSKNTTGVEEGEVP